MSKKPATYAPLRTGVYSVKNVVNGKLYIGSASSSFKQRWAEHQSLLRRGKHYSSHLQNAWNKHGKDAFVFSVVERCPATECIVKEQHWIDLLDACDKRIGYNINPVAGSRLNAKHTEESKKKIAAARTGTKAAPVTARALRVGRLARLVGKSRAADSLRLYCRNKRTSKRFVATDPRGVAHAGKNLRQFCKLHSLSYRAMKGVAQGETHKTVNGWRCSYV